jgi:TRAP transporter TAXI family solute receptor
VQDTIGKDVYKGMDADNKQATVMNLLVANQNMDEKTAYNIVKTIFEHKPEWEAVHKSAVEVVLANQKQANSPVPFHPGAIKYFTEKGIKLTN